MLSRFEQGVWRLRSFRLLMSASMISIFGSLITATAFPFIAINELDAGPTEIALLSLCSIIPTAILGSFAGMWVDRWSRRVVLIVTDLTRAGALMTIPIAWWLDRLSLWLLFAVAFVTSLAKLCSRIADRSILPSVVGRTQIEEANATLSGGSALSEAAGFSVGGLLVQILSGPIALLVDAVTFLFSAFLVSKLPVDSPPPDEELTEESVSHWKHEIAEGLRFLRGSRVLSPLAVTVFLMAVGMETTGTVYFLFVNETLGFSVGALGFIFASGGIGSLIGAALTTRATATFGAGLAMIGALVMLGLSWASITLATGVSVFAVALLLGQQLSDAFWLFYESTSTSVRQLHAPEEMLGRINGAFESVEFTGLLIGAGLGAAIGEFVGLRAALITGGSLVILSALPLWLSPVRQLKGVAGADIEIAIDSGITSSM
jgi:predicted MFS family arabinose efflux permease